MISCVRGGGQTGADQGGWLAAESRKVPTTGAMPKGFLTLDGPRPDFYERFGAYELPTDSYAERTRENVREADFTLRIAEKWFSRGEKCTARAIVDFKKPHFDISIRRGPGQCLIVDEDAIFRAIDAIYLVHNTIGRDIVMNVAGNSEDTCRGIGGMAEAVVKMILDGACGYEP